MDSERNTPNISNVKIRFHLSPKVGKHITENIKYWQKHCKKRPQYFLCTKFANYIIFQNNLVYTIFTNLESTYFKINITGIRDLKKISGAVRSFCEHFGVLKEHRPTTVIIDSIFASGTFKRCINLRKLKRSINSNLKSDFRVKFNCETAAAAYCRHRFYGSIGVFGNGKYIILGVKCKIQLINLFQALNALIRKL